MPLRKEKTAFALALSCRLSQWSEFPKPREGPRLPWAPDGKQRGESCRKTELSKSIFGLRSLLERSL